MAGEPRREACGVPRRTRDPGKGDRAQRRPCLLRCTGRVDRARGVRYADVIDRLRQSRTAGALRTRFQGRSMRQAGARTCWGLTLAMRNAPGRRDQWSVEAQWTGVISACEFKFEAHQPDSPTRRGKTGPQPSQVTRGALGRPDLGVAHHPDRGLDVWRCELHAALPVPHAVATILLRALRTGGPSYSVNLRVRHT